MNAARFTPLLVSVLCLSACAAGPSGPAVGRYPAADGGAEGGPPLASLPAAAGRVVALRRIPYANGFGQEIVLDGPRAMAGENRITVEALTTPHTGLRGQGLDELKIGPPADTDLMAEMDRALPGVAMQMAAAPAPGLDGPIGYAFGTAGRLSCVYAWRYEAPPHPVSLFEGATDGGVLPMSVRVRLCREQPVASLVETLSGLRVARPDGPTAPVAVLALPGGDALDAAVGALPVAAQRDGATRRDGAATEASAPASAERGARPGHRRRRRVASRHGLRHRVAAAVRGRAEPRGDGPGFAGSPPVPMPGDVAASEASPPRPGAQPAPRSASADADAMPMPR